jgi:hypothetical protein
MPTSLPPRVPTSEHEKHMSTSLLIVALVLTSLLVLTQAHARYRSAWLDTGFLFVASDMNN